MTDDGKERQVTIDFEPFRPINTSLYLCDNKFHVEALSELLEDDQKFGFIVMDGNGCLFGTVFGNTERSSTNSAWNFPKSTAEVASLLYVLPVFVWKKGTITLQKWQNFAHSSSLLKTEST